MGFIFALELILLAIVFSTKLKSDDLIFSWSRKVAPLSLLILAAPIFMTDVNQGCY